MKELELKYITPYLPYRLKGSFNLKDVVNTYKNEVREKELTCDSSQFFYLYCKPILLPMSKLHTRIWRELALENTYSNNDDYLVMKDFNAKCYLSYEFKTWLISNHFDVFNLIDKGLALSK